MFLISGVVMYPVQVKLNIWLLDSTNLKPAWLAVLTNAL